MTASSPPMTTSRAGCLPAENLAPGRHRHSQTAAVSSRRGDERTRAETLVFSRPNVRLQIAGPSAYSLDPSLLGLPA